MLSWCKMICLGNRHKWVCCSRFKITPCSSSNRWPQFTLYHLLQHLSNRNLNRLSRMISRSRNWLRINNWSSSSTRRSHRNHTPRWCSNSKYPHSSWPLANNRPYSKKWIDREAPWETSRPLVINLVIRIPCTKIRKYSNNSRLRKSKDLRTYYALSLLSLRSWGKAS